MKNPNAQKQNQGNTPSQPSAPRFDFSAFPRWIIGAVVAILGIGFFALPAGIIAAGFISEVRNSGCREDTTPSDARLTSLERLAELKANGYLTEEEFLQEKQKILEER